MSGVLGKCNRWSCEAEVFSEPSINVGLSCFLGRSVAKIRSPAVDIGIILSYQKNCRRYFRCSLQSTDHINGCCNCEAALTSRAFLIRLLALREGVSPLLQCVLIATDTAVPRWHCRGERFLLLRGRSPASCGSIPVKLSVAERMAFQDPQRRLWDFWATLLVAVVCVLSKSLSTSGQSNVTKVKGGYYTAGSSSLLPSAQIEAGYFTHLFFAFVQIDPKSYAVVVPAGQTPEMQGFSASVKTINSAVLTLISIRTDGTGFAPVLMSKIAQAAFINSSISLARSLNFDGLDLDWEYSQSQDQMTAFGSLIGDWRKAIVQEAEQSEKSPLLLTAAVYFASSFPFPGVGNGTYPIAAITENLDFVNIMCYDFHGSWDKTATGANANLYAPNTIGTVLSADHGIRTWLDAGLPLDKAVLGLTMYGRSWTLQNQNLASGLGAAATAAGPAQPVSNTPGIFYYSEIPNWIDTNNASVVQDLQNVTAYCYADNVWISYEDPLVISVKVFYAKARSLRGYFFWQVGFDLNWELSSAASHTLDYATVIPPPDLPPSLVPTYGGSGRTRIPYFWATSLLLAVLVVLLGCLFDVKG